MESVFLDKRTFDDEQILHSNHLQVLCLCVHMLLTLLQDDNGTCWSFSCWSAFVSSYGIVLCHIQWEQLQLMVQLMAELSCAQVLYKCVYFFPKAPNSMTVMELVMTPSLMTRKLLELLMIQYCQEQRIYFCV